MLRMLLIGCGEMGGALLEGWHATNVAFDISIVTPNQKSIPEQCRSYTWYPSSKDIPAGSFDVLFIAVKPGIALDVLRQCYPALKSDGLICSIAAGLSHAMYQHTHVVRFMPNLPVKIGQGVTLLHGTKTITGSLRDNVTKLAQAVGSAFWIDDEIIFDQMTVLASCGVGYLLEIMAVYSRIVAKSGVDPSVAQEIVQHLFSGVSAYSKEIDAPFQSIVHKLGGAGSLTLAGLEILRCDDKIELLLQEAVTASLQRGAKVRKTAEAKKHDSAAQCDPDS